MLRNQRLECSYCDARERVITVSSPRDLNQEITALIPEISEAARPARRERNDDVDATTRLLAVEVLLTDVEELNMDPLEGDLYELRDRLKGEIAGDAA